MAALLTGRAAPPNSACARAATASMASGSDTSASNAVAPSIPATVSRSFSGCSPTASTCAPRSASSRAVAAPMPVAAPVTIAVLPERDTGRADYAARRLPRARIGSASRAGGGGPSAAHGTGRCPMHPPSVRVLLCAGLTAGALTTGAPAALDRDGAPALNWKACGDAPGVQLGTLRAPLDYDRPDDGKIGVFLARSPATG